MNVWQVRRYVKGLIMTAMCRLKGVIIRDRVVCLGKIPSVGGKGRIEIGSRVSFRGIRAQSRLSAGHGGNLSIGDFCFINSGAVIEASISIKLGAYCLIGERVSIVDNSHHEVAPGEGIRRAPITIAKNVWIGADVLIMPGVTIGEHSVIAARSVVTKDVPSRSVVAGVPARLIRQFECPDDYRRL